MAFSHNNNVGTGDPVIIGIGAVVPEPGVITLAGVCGILALVLRRRK